MQTFGNITDNGILAFGGDQDFAMEVLSGLDIGRCAITAMRGNN
jgi:hypothetical protein